MSQWGKLWVCALTVLAVHGAPFQEVETNKTIDQVLAEANKGLSGMTDDGLILSEYDMLLTPEQFEVFYGQQSDKSKRNAIKDPTLRWKDATIVWKLQGSSYTKKQSFELQQSMTQIERYTCVKFKQRAKEKNYIYYVNGQGCRSQVGMKNWGMQYVSLASNGCRHKGLYVHESLHALGVVHEHQRPDRDKYLDIFMKNVKPGMESAFTKRAANTVNLHGVEYELASIMHYGTTAFSKDGKSKTLLPKDQSKEKYIGKVYLKGISYTDVKNLNLMYDCAKNCPASDKNKCGANGFLDQNCNCICRDGSMDCDPKRRDNNRKKSCKNSHYNSWDCFRWAAEGECENNKSWMLKKCQRACYVCDKKPQPSGPCKDVHPSCLMFKTRGDCEVYPDWMNMNCRKTCNFCNGIKATRPENSCGNKYGDDAKCDGWASDGECRINPSWMAKNCAKSCNACKISCSDKSDSTKCENWAGNGECQVNPTWMPFNCARSCNTCELV